MLIGSYFDGWDDAAQKLRLDLLPQIANFGLNTICQIADFSNPAIDEAFPAAAKANGLNIILQPNTGDYAKLNTVYNPNSHVLAWDCMDDADIAGLEKTKERIALLKPFAVGKKTYITVSKGADHAVFANLADWYHVQNYHYREGLKQWSWTRMLEARKQCKGQLFHGPSLLKMTPIGFAIKNNNRYYTIDNEYVPLQYNAASILAAICAGINGVIYYTLFNGYAEMYGKDPTQKYYHGILERPDFVDGYKNFHAMLQLYDAFWQINNDPTKGTRVTFEAGNIVGATFTLNNAAKDWIRVEIDTTEFNATWRIIDSRDVILKDLFKTPIPPPVPGVVKVAVNSNGVQVTGSGVTFVQ